MENTPNTNLFYNKDFWWKISDTIKIFFNNKNLIILWIALWLLSFVIVAIWAMFWFAGFWVMFMWSKSMWMQHMGFLWIVWLIILVLVIFVALVVANILWSIVTILSLKSLKNNQPIDFWKIIETSKSELGHFIKIAIAWFLYMLTPILILLGWIVIMVIWVWTKNAALGWIGSLIFLWWMIYSIIKWFDLLLIYNIWIVEKLPAKESLEKSIKLMDWNKLKSFWVILVLNIIVWIIISIIVNIFGEQTFLWWLFNNVLSWCLWVMNAIILYFLYTEFTLNSSKKLDESPLPINNNDSIEQL